ncbi:MAG: hypothetical protein ACQEWD_11975 [Bacteroidota bacterium]
MESLLKTIELKDTSLEFYSKYVISNVKEDVIFEDHHVEQILKICKVVFDYRPFVYISNRRVAYNVNPIIYFGLKNLDDLVGIAIVTNESKGQKTAHFEKQFSPIPFDIFTNMEEAIAWSKSLLNKK